jgi:hypothetical protein
MKWTASVGILKACHVDRIEWIRQISQSHSCNQATAEDGEDVGRGTLAECEEVEAVVGEVVAPHQAVVAGRDVSEAKGESYFARSL